MKRKSFWVGLGLTLLLVAVMAPSLVLTSCGTTASSTTTTPVVNANTPQYGGSLTVYTNWGNANPTGFDDLTAGLPQATVWDNPFTEMLCTGDIVKYGPRGTNDFGFNTYENVPEQYLGGVLATSWEIQPLVFTFHLRHGVMFTGNTNIGMASRELTSADVIYSIERTMSTAGPNRFFNFIKNLTAPDAYTVVINLNSYAANWEFLLGAGMNMGAIQPKEMAVANATGDNWQNAVGTGPFILTDYVPGSGATYTKNQNYWGKTTINGTEYQLPFINTLHYPIITDASTALAAVRTGKIDWDPFVPITNQKTLADSAPTLIQDKYLGGKVDILKINRLASQYLNNKNVRQALLIGTDLQTISNLLYNGGPIVSWPLGPQVPGFTPLAQLPAADQLLYQYNTTLAKKMISDAGFPNGFTIQLYTDAAHVDLANAVADEWSQINVKLVIKILDTTSMTTAANNATYPDLLMSGGYTVVNPLTTLNLVDGTRIGPTYLTSEPFQAIFAKMSANTDPVSRTADVKALAVSFIDDVGAIPFAQAYTLNCHWPWVKNYYGELDAGYYNQMAMIKLIWVDQSAQPKQ